MTEGMKKAGGDPALIANTHPDGGFAPGGGNKNGDKE
jgi:hypothetical protein